MSSDIAELERRVTAVEREQAQQRMAERFAALEKETADIRIAFEQQMRLLNAFGRVQSDQNSTLRRQGEATGGLVLEVTTIRQTQVDHGVVLTEHGQTLAEHGRTMAEHTRMLTGHGQMLTDQEKLLHQVLSRLPVPET
ncbi:hypothetical protein [Actinomadura sp. DC4]|uniref:hypothetical protein n=1 Tax=Actinomadura sp. DC4 TaxID=3055069 RepID=UPI0025B00FCD|nr:hypothetical protein [Actinomadura sp. DC4]MDN3359722.1 hypothetical protein [Actinomadura sp. DC4]